MMPPDRWRRNRDDGFTLIETIVVVVVLGLMAMLILGRGPSRSSSLELQAAARGVAGALQAARDRAITTDRPVEVGREAVETAARGALASNRKAGEAIRLSLHSPAIDPREDGVLRFDPDGGSSGARITAMLGAARIDVSVDWLTGRISEGPLRRGDAG